jgi:hypothetical protein
LRRLALAAVCGVVGALLATFGLGVQAQIPAVKFDVRAAKGLLVSPVYEGWYEVDGTKYVMFGYVNRNLQETFDIPVGPQNNVTPGPADQGQPTHFFPGVSYGVFAAAVPKDRPTTEVTWTLAANGQTFSVPGSLDPLYIISPQLENGTNYPGNKPPTLKFDPTGPSTQGPYGMVVRRTASVSRPLAIDVWITDDGLPPPPPPRRAGPARAAGRIISRREVQGLALGWQLYRGTGNVSFSEEAPAIEQGKARTTVNFSAPGDYMLQVVAIDSRSANRCCWTNGYVKVTVDAGAPPR